MAPTSDNPYFDFDDDSLNPFLIQLGINGNPVPVTLQEDNRPVGAKTSRVGRNGKTTQVRE